MMNKQLLEDFFEVCNSYNPMHGFGSESGSRAAGSRMFQIREYVVLNPELKPVDKAFFNYWYKGDEKPQLEDFL
jgi:hypothetical protein